MSCLEEDEIETGKRGSKRVGGGERDIGTVRRTANGGEEVVVTEFNNGVL